MAIPLKAKDDAQNSACMVGMTQKRRIPHP